MICDYLLNKVILKDGREYIGVIDYVTTKQIFFFDISNEPSVDYTLLCMMWRGNHEEMRFSVFCAIEYPNITLPNVILLPQNNIQEIKGKLPDFKKPKQKKRILKNL